MDEEGRTDGRGRGLEAAVGATRATEAGAKASSGTASNPRAGTKDEGPPECRSRRADWTNSMVCWDEASGFSAWTRSRILSNEVSRPLRKIARRRSSPLMKPLCTDDSKAPIKSAKRRRSSTRKTSNEPDCDNDVNSRR